MSAVQIITTAVSIVSSVVFALIASVVRSEVGTLRAQIETLRAEMRACIAESAHTFYREVNGAYVKKDLYSMLISRVDGLEQRVNDLRDR